MCEARPNLAFSPVCPSPPDAEACAVSCPHARLPVRAKHAVRAGQLLRCSQSRYGTIHQVSIHIYHYPTQLMLQLLAWSGSNAPPKRVASASVFVTGLLRPFPCLPPVATEASPTCLPGVQSTATAIMRCQPRMCLVAVRVRQSVAPASARPSSGRLRGAHGPQGGRV